MGTHAYTIIVSYYVELHQATIILTLCTNKTHINGYMHTIEHNKNLLAMKSLNKRTMLRWILYIVVPLPFWLYLNYFKDNLFVGNYILKYQNLIHFFFIFPSNLELQILRIQNMENGYK